MSPLFKKVRDWYSHYERPLSSISLIGGFVFDAVTLKRVDLFWENFWVVVHLVIVAVFIILINMQENDKLDEKDASKAHFWYINILQFFFGGLLSTFLVFYFRSATISVTWPFLLVLLIAFVANESLKKHYSRLIFQIGLLYLSILSFSIFLLPVLFHRIGPDIFVLSGVLSVIAIWLFMVILGALAKGEFKKRKNIVALGIFLIFVATNLLYFFNLIPPIPLWMKDGGVYHSITRNASGDYLVGAESQGWREDLDFIFPPTYHAVAGEPIFAYSAIFAPNLFSTAIVHEWQQYDSASASWVTMSRVSLTATGGRDGGYRTYSEKLNITAGEWRVNVETAGGQIIGRLRFNVEVATSDPAIATQTKT